MKKILIVIITGALVISLTEIRDTYKTNPEACWAWLCCGLWQLRSLYEEIIS